jgi:hypothetical protein
MLTLNQLEWILFPGIRKRNQLVLTRGAQGQRDMRDLDITRKLKSPIYFIDAARFMSSQQKEPKKKRKNEMGRFIA